MARAEHRQCLKSELDIFEIPTVQVSQERGFWVQHFSSSLVSDGGPLIFRIPASQDLYVDLNSTYLRLYFKIVDAAGNDVASDAKVSTTNLTLHSLFSQVDVFLNEKMISAGSPTYAYRAYLETVLNYGKDAKTSHLQQSLFFKDSAGKFEDLTGRNLGFSARASFAKAGIQLAGRLHCDIFNQDKYLINSVDMTIKCIRNSPDFVLLYDPESTSPPSKYNYIITDASLLVRKVKVAPSVRIAHESVLSKNNNVKMPISRVLCNVYSVAIGSQNFNKDSLFQTSIPNRVVIALVRASAYNGECKENPFFCNHYDVSSVNFYVDDESVMPMNLDFGKNNYADAYLNLYHASRMFTANTGNDISMFDFVNGYTLFTFDTTPDMDDQRTLYRRGNTRLEIKFKNSLPETICVLVYAEFSNLIEITKDRSIFVDFTV